jgi:hypothetical protein
MSDRGGYFLVPVVPGNSNHNAGIFLNTFRNDFPVFPADILDALNLGEAYFDAFVDYLTGERDFGGWI